jgi:hypothetical protein
MSKAPNVFSLSTRRTLHAGFDLHMVKPMEHAALRTLLQAMCTD